MTTSSTNPIYEQLLAWCQSFHRRMQPQPVDGQIYEQSGTTVYHAAVQKLDTGGRIEINLITPEAQGFSWLAELTIDDAANTLYQHVLLQNDGSIVETYGKTVIPVSDGEAEVILDRLERLSPTNA